MLTKRQRDCLLFLQDYQDRHGDTPSFDTMAEALNVAAKSSIHRLVSGLVERGFILHERGSKEIHIVRTVGGGKAPPTPGRVPIFRSGDHKLMGYLP